MKMLLRMFILGSVLCLTLACGKEDRLVEEKPVSTPPEVLADNPDAVISDTLQRFRGRWIQEIDDPNKPNPPTMRMFKTANNTLSGRFLFAGAFADTGVAATLVQDGNTFTLTLTDDELRPHDWIPKERVLTGSFDASTQTLELKSRDGSEFMRFELQTEKFALKFSGNVYHCTFVAGRDASGASGSGGSGTSIPVGGSGSGGTISVPDTGSGGTRTGGSWSWSSGDSVPSSGPVNRLELSANEPRVAPTPTASPAPGRGVPAARLMSCGVMSLYQDSWSRMSGSG